MTHLPLSRRSLLATGAAIAMLPAAAHAQPTPVRGGVLRMSVDQAVGVLNPLLSRVNPEYLVAEMLYSGLTRLAHDLHPSPAAAVGRPGGGPRLCRPGAQLEMALAGMPMLRPSSCAVGRARPAAVRPSSCAGRAPIASLAGAAAEDHHKHLRDFRGNDSDRPGKPVASRALASSTAPPRAGQPPSPHGVSSRPGGVALWPATPLRRPVHTARPKRGANTAQRRVRRLGAGLRRAYDGDGNCACQRYGPRGPLPDTSLSGRKPVFPLLLFYLFCPKAPLSGHKSLRGTIQAGNIVRWGGWLGRHIC